MFGIEQHIIDSILSEIIKHKEIVDTLVFGSRAKGNYKKGSDIDLAVKGEKVTFQLIAKLKTAFNQKMRIPYRVDIIHYEAITNPDLLDHIDRVGVSIIDSDIEKT